MVPGIGTWWECRGDVDNVDKDRLGRCDYCISKGGISTYMSVEMCRYLFRKGRRGGWVRQRRVGKVRFRICSNDRQSKMWYTFGWRHI